ncbi:MAG: deoxyribodipyrimidine photo-lyase [Sphingomonadales bacterium]
MTQRPHIIWLRQDLRLAGQPAVAAAAQSGAPLLFVYVLDDAAPGHWRLGGAARWWLHHSLQALNEAIIARGGALILRRGDAVTILASLCREAKAEAVHATAHYEPWARRQERALAKALAAAGTGWRLHGAGLMVEPGRLLTGQGQPYQVFTPYWRAWQAAVASLRSQPMPAPAHLAAPADLPASDALEAWRLRPTRPDWSGGLAASWRPGEQAAMARLHDFAAAAAAQYGQGRDRVDADGTSRLSPYLHWGELSAAQVIDHLNHVLAPEAAEPFIRQLAWRDFCHDLLAHDPDMADRSWRAHWRGFPWRDDPDALRAWQCGRTGYPIVDAAMRGLWHEGWMHNRARMIVASFLTKDLLLPWQAGAAWFWDTLVDANLANNSAGWQWVAGSGADAAPYFRIFNPITQARKFDPEGRFVRRWLPQLAALPDTYLQQPWQAPPLQLHEAGVALGRDYPQPMIDHGLARRRALDMYQRHGNAATAAQSQHHAQ